MKGTCSECGRKFALTKDGVVQRHLELGMSRENAMWVSNVECLGSALLPVASAAHN